MMTPVPPPCWNPSSCVVQCFIFALSLSQAWKKPPQWSYLHAVGLSLLQSRGLQLVPKWIEASLYPPCISEKRGICTSGLILHYCICINHFTIGYHRTLIAMFCGSRFRQPMNVSPENLTTCAGLVSRWSGASWLNLARLGQKPARQLIRSTH